MIKKPQDKKEVTGFTLKNVKIMKNFAIVRLGLIRVMNGKEVAIERRFKVSGEDFDNFRQVIVSEVIHWGGKEFENAEYISESKFNAIKLREEG